jgi:hypothetical protein
MGDPNDEAWHAAAELERQGDAAAAAGQPAEDFYRQAQKTLLPTGVLWSDGAEYDRRLGAFNRIQRKIWDLKALPPARPSPEPTAAYRKFADSTNITYERWHDGTGYDLEALAQSSEAERAAVANDLIAQLSQGEGDWRDVDALLTLDPPQTREILEAALPRARLELRLHIARALAERGVPVEIDRIIADILRSGRYEDGLSLALDLAPEYATPYLREVLLECVHAGHKDVRVHAAALVLYLAGKADSPFDWNERPFFLQFGEESKAVRDRAYAELCRRIGRPSSGQTK